MLTLYRKNDCSLCDAVESQLRELRLAHRVLDMDAFARESGVTADAVAPVVRDDDETFIGPEAIGEHLEQVARIKDRWQQHGSDACYCDE